MSWRNKTISILLLLFAWPTAAQELFPLNEPASSVPKGVVGVRLFSQNYREVNRTRTMQYLRVMYGLTPRLSVYATGTFSNHHNKQLPPDLINHIHSGNSTSYFTQNIQRGVRYPYLFNGLHAYAKYRFISRDGQNRHFRMAAYGEWSGMKSPHDEAEPDLLDDTGGHGYGLITTWLQKRFAISLTTGRILPKSYFEMQPDQSGGPDMPTNIHYGNATVFNLSLGYLVYPKHYTSYEQPNWNFYLEFIGKTYEAARVIQNGIEISTATPALTAGSYLEVHPGIQKIIKSNTRVELTAGFDFIGRSYAHFNPQWTLAVQRYFFR